MSREEKEGAMSKDANRVVWAVAESKAGGKTVAHSIDREAAQDVARKLNATARHSGWWQVERCLIIEGVAV